MDEQELDDFYTASFDRLVHQVHAMIGGPRGAQDCVQEAFVRAWSHRTRLDRARVPEPTPATATTWRSRWDAPRCSRSSSPTGLHVGLGRCGRAAFREPGRARAAYRAVRDWLESCSDQVDTSHRLEVVSDDGLGTPHEARPEPGDAYWRGRRIS